ncbi:MAG TPA: hypothetical protein VGO33_02530 [Gemmatimonadaceae bacterium]|nr:hypothetical protein [Gemmatimonadaceae bacterium]
MTVSDSECLSCVAAFAITPQYGRAVQLLIIQQSPHHHVPTIETTDPEVFHNRALFKRIIIAWQDLEDARGAVTRLLCAPTRPAPPQSDQVVKSALITSAIVSYGRLFIRTRRQGGVPGCLPEDFEHLLPEEQRILHQRLLDLRSKEFAHSDADVADISVTCRPEYMGGVLLPRSRRLRTDSVSDADLRDLNNILSKLHVYLHDEMMRLYPLLAFDGDF